ncbi:hypothetical protein J437_LFUL006800 [Ladona fulva]|uniref:Uncharacterized protein n=1 Tax=Ladona fulva TaxID=123851 RepID=A0A8K0P262_LADFU|nr:hypothetical protein J437_LFUL006800 [Ladona fulva]
MNFASRFTNNPEKHKCEENSQVIKREDGLHSSSNCENKNNLEVFFDSDNAGNNIEDKLFTCLQFIRPISKETSQKSLQFIEFRLQLIQDAIGKYHDPNFKSPKGRPSKILSPLTIRLTERHILRHIPPNQIKKEPRRQCTVCFSKKDETGIKAEGNWELEGQSGRRGRRASSRCTLSEETSFGFPARLEPPSDFSDRLELSETECDRDTLRHLKGNLKSGSPLPHSLKGNYHGHTSEHTHGDSSGIEVTRGLTHEHRQRNFTIAVRNAHDVRCATWDDGCMPPKTRRMFYVKGQTRYSKRSFLAM